MAYTNDWLQSSNRYNVFNVFWKKNSLSLNNELGFYLSKS